MTLSNTQSSQKTFQKGCTRISLEIKPVMLPFFTPFEVDKKHHTLKPYMAPVNHNIINKTTWIKIVHTLMGNFCQESDDKDDMNALENMGNDACVIVGYHKKASEFTTNVGHFPNWNNPYEMWTNKYRI
jgi:hypothetical protein